VGKESENRLEPGAGVAPVTIAGEEAHPSRAPRNLSSGEDLDPEKIRAKYSAGVLTVHLPKVEIRKSRKIDVVKT
jgi:HSP20 family molecular chaperone IbpA